MVSCEIKDDVTIVLCGEAGQGIQSVEFLLTRFLHRGGYNFFATKEYMSRVRGGANSTEIRVSSKRVNASTGRIDLLFPLSKQALAHVKNRISSETVVFGEKSLIFKGEDSGDLNLIDVPFSEMATKIGNAIYSNTIATGVIAGLLGIEKEPLIDFLSGYFMKKGQDVARDNVLAFETGYSKGHEIADSGIVCIEITQHPEVAGESLLSGAEAVGIGALAGGCNFLSSYPMSPSTNVLTYLAEKVNEFDIIVEQAEDEISALNMVIGASYAGARGMVTTSGGGFALMTEAVSLAGMLETPVVIHLSQRPGPATGLPTRTEQGDLNLALYSGHGEFPRAILTPGCIEDAFSLTKHAFNLADKSQSPVFILSDQYIMDSYYNSKIEFNDVKPERYFVETSPEYRRYELSPDGISPRGIPGFGSGLVVCDSDEHDEEGHITEDLALRIKMNDKRLKKQEILLNEALPPEFAGLPDAPVMVVCWGSTYTTVKEAVERLGRSDVTVVYFKQVYPLHHDTAKILGKAKTLIIVEGNATAQFASILKLYAGVEISQKILKYNGLQFTVDELKREIGKIITG